MSNKYRRYNCEIISEPKNHHGWFKGMVGQVVNVRFVNHQHEDLLYGLTEDFKYIRKDHLKVIPKVYFEEAQHEDHNEPICSHFGCSEKLSSYGNLFNDRCPDHQQRQKVDIMKVLKFK